MLSGEERTELVVIVGDDTGDRRRPFVAPPDGDREAGTVPRVRIDARVLLASAFVALAIVAALIVASGSDDDEAAPHPVEPPALSPLPAPDGFGAVGEPGAMRSLPHVSHTVVGTIGWVRHDRGTELPSRIGIDADGSLVGSDGDLSWWRPAEAEDPTRWLRALSVDREVGEERWRLRRSDEVLGLTIITRFGWENVRLDKLVESLPTGFVARVEPDPGPADGFPIEIGGDVFLLATVRVGLPWTDIAQVTPDGSYRVELSDGERAIRLAHGRFHELPVEEFVVVSRGVGPTHDLVDADGRVVWSFEVAAGRGALEAAWGRFETAWLRWNGSRFVAIERPWPDRHEVDMVRVGDGLLARADGPLHREVTLWYSGDGTTWTPVQLPAERARRTPVALRRDGDGAILTLFAPGGFQVWSTRDGRGFDRLPDVPGVDERRRGDFGWVAADPRSSPTLRVSADGATWEEVDLAELLDLDASRWDVTITAAARGRYVVVVADRPDGRSILVGEVEPLD